MANNSNSSPLGRLARGLYLTLFALSLVVVVLFLAWKLLLSTPEQLPPITQVTIVDNPDTDVDETALVRKEGYYTVLLAATDQGGGNADTIMVVSYDTVNQAVGVVSIPRDTIVDRDGTPKINAAYSGSDPAEALRTTVSTLIGIPIDFYATVSLTAFQALVDEVGGVEFYVPCDMNYDDPVANPPLSIHYTEGLQYLTGAQAMEVVRFRKNNDGSGYTDVGRTQTQQQLLTTVVKKVLSWSSIGKIDNYLEIYNQYVATDMELGHMAWFATKALGVDFDTGISYATLPGDGSATYRGYTWCYALEPEACLEIFNQMLNPYTTDLTLEMTGIVVP